MVDGQLPLFETAYQSLISHWEWQKMFCIVIQPYASKRLTNKGILIFQFVGQDI